jgi:hypothetical protein
MHTSTSVAKTGLELWFVPAAWADNMSRICYPNKTCRLPKQDNLRTPALATQSLKFRGKNWGAQHRTRQESDGSCICSVPSKPSEQVVLMKCK